MHVNKANQCVIKQASSQRLIDKQSNVNESSNDSNTYLISFFFVNKMTTYFQSMLLFLCGTKSFADFHQAVNWLASQRSIKPIGPTIPSVYLDRQLEDDREYGLSLFKPNLDGCKEWLDSKETGSVVYVSYGSMAALGEEQMAENCLGPKEEWLLLLVGSQRIGKEKTSKQLCGGVIREGSDCDLEPAARGSGSQVCWLLHDTLWVELNTRGVELRSTNGGNATVD